MNFGKAPNSEPLGGNLLSRLANVVKTNASGAAQPKQSNSMNNSNSSDFFIRMALDMLQNSKETKRMESLRKAIQNAMSNVSTMFESYKEIAENLINERFSNLLEVSFFNLRVC